MPIVRGKIIPEVQSTGRAKRMLDVLLWLKEPDKTMAWFDELEQLRVYTTCFELPVCFIRLFVPSDDQMTSAALDCLGIEKTTAEKRTDVRAIPDTIRNVLDAELQEVASTALAIDADVIVTDTAAWFPYVEEFDKLGLLLTSADFLLGYAEVFARGHDLPWSFSNKAWFETWTAFYQLSEEWTFKPGIDFLNFCQTKGAAKEAIETCRSLVYNRLGDLCFTRDRLLFYEMQQSVAKRAHWKRQKFSSEAAYYLNFYYLLLYGAFDHVAVVVNNVLNLGFNERHVSARNPQFLAALRTRAADVGAVFEDPRHTSFIKRVAAVRHIAAHRGVVTPTLVVQEPDHEPTNDELDEDIRNAGLDATLNLFSPGPAREGWRQTLRTNARMARYQRHTLMEDVILVKIDDKWFWIKPLLDTAWNFQRCKAFLDDAFKACAKAIA